MSDELREARDGAESFVLALQSSGTHLCTSITEVTTRLSSRLEQRIVPAASSLYLSTDTANRAFATYVSELTDVYRSADLVEQHVEYELGVVGREQLRIAEIAVNLGLSPEYAWDDPPPAEFPTHGQPTRSLLVQDEYRSAWRTASRSWESALAAIDYEQKRWRELIEDRKSAEQSLKRACIHTVVGELASLANGTQIGLESTIISNLLRGEEREFWDGAAPRTSHPLLVGLIGTSSGAEIWASPPNPDEVAARWRELPEWKREALIVAVPWVIGNLPGVTFSDRDRANRRMLTGYLSEQRHLSPQSKLALAEVTRVLYATDNDPPRSLIALDLGDGIPNVAIGYGAVDEAEHLNWAVPGMLSDAHRALPSWDRAMENQFLAQADIQGHDSEESSALIAFLSYDTPNLATVLGEGAARIGADRLAAEFDGTFAARAADNAQVLHGAIGHSYGTTTLVAAASRVTHPLDQISLVASAGLDAEGFTSLADLRVRHDEAGNPRIYTTLAKTDWLARFGTDISGRLQPNPGEASLPWRSAAPVYVFSSDGLGELKAAEGHNIINSTGTGYFDRGTQSSDAIAAIATGHSELVPGGLDHTASPVLVTYPGPGVIALMEGMQQ
ncbi:MAG: alpha/beta hydrolase [Leucobacter sp.]